MRKSITILFCIICQTSIYAQVKVGSEVQLKQINLTPITASTLADSKFIVLDFWATWCAPCIASFPHLDSLQKKYKQKVQIAAISDETSLKVSNFLKTRSYSFNFFIDPDKTAFKLFDVESRPLTALLDANKILLWVGSSNELDAVLEQALRGKSHVALTSGYNQFYSKYYNTPIQNTANTLYTYTISLSRNTDEYEAKTQKGSLLNNPINIYYVATPVSEIVQDLVGISNIQFSNQRPELDTILLNIKAKSTSDQITYSSESKRLIADLQSIFNFKIIETYQEREAFSLIVVDSKKLLENKESISGGGMVDAKGEKFKILRLSLAELSYFFQKKLKVLTIYDGVDTSKFNLELDKFKTTEELNLQLKDKFGLELVPVKSKVKFVELK